MAKTVEIWDKTSPINGYPAAKFLDERGQEFGEEDIILILDGDRVVNVEKPSTLKANLVLADTLTSMEIGQAYLTNLAEQETKAQTEQITTTKLQERLDDMSLVMADLIGGE